MTDEELAEHDREWCVGMEQLLERGESLTDHQLDQTLDIVRRHMSDFPNLAGELMRRELNMTDEESAEYDRRFCVDMEQRLTRGENLTNHQLDLTLDIVRRHMSAFPNLAHELIMRRIKTGR